MQKYFENSSPIHTNDTFLVHGGEHPIQFKVIKTNPSPFCIVAATTALNFSDPIKPNDQDVSLVQTMLNIARDNKNMKALNQRFMNMITDTNKKVIAQDGVIEKQNNMIECLKKEIKKQDKVIEKQDNKIECLKKEINEQKGCLISIRNVLEEHLSTSTSNAQCKI